MSILYIWVDGDSNGGQAVGKGVKPYKRKVALLLGGDHHNILLHASLQFSFIDTSCDWSGSRQRFYFRIDGRSYRLQVVLAPIPFSDIVRLRFW